MLCCKNNFPCTASKLLTRIMLERMKDGFMFRNSCIDNKCVLTVIKEILLNYLVGIRNETGESVDDFKKRESTGRI